MSRFATYLQAVLEVAGPMMEDLGEVVANTKEESWWGVQTKDSYRCLEAQLNNLANAKHNAVMLDQIDVIIVITDALNEHLGRIETASINHMMRTAYHMLAQELSAQARKEAAQATTGEAGRCVGLRTQCKKATVGVAFCCSKDQDAGPRNTPLRR